MRLRLPLCKFPCVALTTPVICHLLFSNLRQLLDWESSRNNIWSYLHITPNIFPEQHLGLVAMETELNG